MFCKISFFFISQTLTAKSSVLLVHKWQLWIKIKGISMKLLTEDGRMGFLKHGPVNVAKNEALLLDLYIFFIINIILHCITLHQNYLFFRIHSLKSILDDRAWTCETLVLEANMVPRDHQSSHRISNNYNMTFNSLTSSCWLTTSKASITLDNSFFMYRFIFLEEDPCTA